MSGQKNWYVRRGQNIKGPHPESVIKRSVLLGRIKDDDDVSQDQTNWKKLKECKHLYPDILLNENTTENQIQEAKIKLDERARDRRGKARTQMEEERRKANDRREQEADDMLEYRERHARVMESLRNRDSKQKNTNRGFIYLLFVSLVILSFAYVYRTPEEISKADCNAVAGEGVNWSNCAMQVMELPGVVLNNAILKNTRLSGSNLLGANLKNADLSYAELSSTTLANAELSGARLKGAGLKNTDLSYANFTDADLSYADLSGANIGGAEFSGSRFDHAIWIDGSVCLAGSIGRCLKNQSD